MTLLNEEGSPLLSFPQSQAPVLHLLPPHYLSRDNNIISLLSDGCLPRFSNAVWDHFVRQQEKIVSRIVPNFKACGILVLDNGPILYVTTILTP